MLHFWSLRYENIIFLFRSFLNPRTFRLQIPKVVGLLFSLLMNFGVVFYSFTFFVILMVIILSFFMCNIFTSIIYISFCRPEIHQTKWCIFSSFMFLLYPAHHFSFYPLIVGVRIVIGNQWIFPVFFRDILYISFSSS